MLARAPRSSVSDTGDEDGADLIAEINITPLTDIFLVLLIIFMVTTSAITQMGVEVSLPKASAQVAQSQPEGVVVTLLASGVIKIQSETIGKGEDAKLESFLRKQLAQTSKKLVVLEGDKQAFLDSAIHVMEVARKSGAESFAIATEK